MTDFQNGSMRRTMRVLESVGFSQDLAFQALRGSVGVAARFGDVIISLSDPVFYEMPFPDEHVMVLRHIQNVQGAWVCADCGAEGCDCTLLEFSSLREALAWVNCTFRKGVCLP